MQPAALRGGKAGLSFYISIVLDGDAQMILGLRPAFRIFRCVAPASDAGEKTRAVPSEWNVHGLLPFDRRLPQCLSESLGTRGRSYNNRKCRAPSPDWLCGPIGLLSCLRKLNIGIRRESLLGGGVQQGFAHRFGRFSGISGPAGPRAHVRRCAPPLNLRTRRISQSASQILAGSATRRRRWRCGLACHHVDYGRQGAFAHVTCKRRRNRSST